MEKITQNIVVGTWELVSFKIIKEGNEKDWRIGAYGMLIYTKDGCMSVSINSSPEDRDWIDSILFYSGTYEVCENNIIRHEVINATSEDRIGKPMVRAASLKKNLLTLSAKGNFGEAVLAWRKK